jgi:NADPH2:quinone reductase
MASSSLPTSMMAIEIRGSGGPEKLVPAERPVPVPGEGEILVRIAAAGVNRPDVHQRQGNYPPPPGVTDIPGLEIAGEVAATGPGASRHAVGDKVAALVAGGGYAEYAAVHESNALPVPAGLSLVEAAAIPETYFTVWSNVFDRGRLKAGETLLVHGGGSGIGTTTIQLAKAFGARVIATAANDAKCEACRKLGADLAINHRNDDFVAIVKMFTDGKGADVILDMVGGDYVARNFAAAAEDGRIVQIAFIGGAIANVDFRPIMLKRLTHTGSTLRSRPVSFKAEIAEAVRKNVWPLLEAGRAKPIIDTTFPLRNAADAHLRIESWEHFGKIVLTV